MTQNNDKSKDEIIEMLHFFFLQRYVNQSHLKLMLKQLKCHTSSRCLLITKANKKIKKYIIK